jgi:multicomponent Na+:H+ antiporter subunit E
MDTIAYLNIILRLTIWFLLTADFSLPNILIGIAIALILPRSYTSKEKLKDWLKTLWKIIKAIPQAYVEAIEMIFRPHDREVIVRQKVKDKRTPCLIFLDIFLITFTPKTIVTKYDDRGWYEVHEVRRRNEEKRRGSVGSVGREGTNN